MAKIEEITMLQTIMDWMQNASIGEWLTAVSQLVAGATAVTLLTPTQWDNKAMNALSKVLNFLAGNFARNKNADG